ncbi:MAG: hypothetical protein EA359_03495 [Balneolaceae bacterium]|nr:MAG: hypothetical protein EA359_03495 [Balneolaceae bacterium]
MVLNGNAPQGWLLQNIPLRIVVSKFGSLGHSSEFTPQGQASGIAMPAGRPGTDGTYSEIRFLMRRQINIPTPFLFIQHLSPTPSISQAFGMAIPYGAACQFET